jgi:hypothetical protein
VSIYVRAIFALPSFLYRVGPLSKLAYTHVLYIFLLLKATQIRLFAGPTLYRKLGNANIARTYIDTRYRMFHPITKTDHNKNGLLKNEDAIDNMIL